MSFAFTARSYEPEQMDVANLDTTTAAAILGALEKVNRWLGGVRATLFHLERFSRRWRPGETIRLIDWGTGGADLPRAIVDWCRRRGFRAEVTGVDNNPTIVAYARERCQEYPEIRILEGNVFASPPAPLPLGEGGQRHAREQLSYDLALAPASGRQGPGEAEPFDYALSSLCLHHLNDEQVVALLEKSDRLARRGLIMNDLKRSGRAWAWIWALTRLGGAHPIVQNDAPLSVRRAFVPKELEHLAARAGLTYMRVSTHFGYRLTLAGEKL